MNQLQMTILVLGVCGWLTGVAGDDKGTAKAAPIPAEWVGKVTDAAQLPVESSAWGTLQWLCNEKLSPGAIQTVGLATILPGCKNPVHFHPNCEEVLYVISGQGRHSYDGRTIELKAGMTIRIPAGVKHNMANTGTETLRTLISFSAGDRKTVFLPDSPAK
ncbi:MAG: cupin domain-containing protein [Verrucomicrobiota bacterium]